MNCMDVGNSFVGWTEVVCVLLLHSWFALDPSKGIFLAAVTFTATPLERAWEASPLRALRAVTCPGGPLIICFWFLPLLYIHSVAAQRSLRTAFNHLPALDYNGNNSQKMAISPDSPSFKQRSSVLPPTTTAVKGDKIPTYYCTCKSPFLPRPSKWWEQKFPFA